MRGWMIISCSPSSLYACSRCLDTPHYQFECLTLFSYVRRLQPCKVGSNVCSGVLGLDKCAEGSRWPRYRNIRTDCLPKIPTQLPLHAVRLSPHNPSVKPSLLSYPIHAPSAFRYSLAPSLLHLTMPTLTHPPAILEQLPPFEDILVRSEQQSMLAVQLGVPSTHIGHVYDYWLARR